ncbi:MAG: hypothetical protein WEC73_05225 [Chthoniobacterales bacterium]
MKASFPALVLSIAAAATAVAQDNPAPPAGPVCQPVEDVWVLQMQNPAREYAVRMTALQAVTLQEYDVRREGEVQRVVELTAETTGGNRARFFWEDKAEPLVKLPDDLARQRAEVEKAVRQVTGVERNDGQAARVTKDYPVTTHSTWAEFKLGNEADVRELHKQLMQMWTGKKREG